MNTNIVVESGALMSSAWDVGSQGIGWKMPDDIRGHEMVPMAEGFAYVELREGKTPEELFRIDASCVKAIYRGFGLAWDDKTKTVVPQSPTAPKDWRSEENLDALRARGITNVAFIGVDPHSPQDRRTCVQTDQGRMEAHEVLGAIRA